MIDPASAKAEILASIRQNLAASRPFDTVYNERYVPDDRVAVTERHEEAMDLLSRFKSNLDTVAGKCHVVHNDQEAAMAIQNILDELKPLTIAISDSGKVNDLIGQINTDADILKNASKSNLFDCDVGITSAHWAIAETGTLVLESDRERSRLTSLLPPVHICVLDAKMYAGQWVKFCRSCKKT